MKADSVPYNWTPQTFEVIRETRAQPYNVELPGGRKIRVFHSGYGWGIIEVSPERRAIALDVDIFAACYWLNQHEAMPAS